jgi:hypothetical protein
MPASVKVKCSTRLTVAVVVTSTHAAMLSLGGLGMLASRTRTERARHGQSMAKAEPFHPHLDGRGRKATSACFASPRDTPRASWLSEQNPRGP